MLLGPLRRPRGRHLTRRPTWWAPASRRPCARRRSQPIRRRPRCSGCWSSAAGIAGLAGGARAGRPGGRGVPGREGSRCRRHGSPAWARCSRRGKNGAELIAMLAGRGANAPSITLFLNAELADKSGQHRRVRAGDPHPARPAEPGSRRPVRIQVGAIVVASGFADVRAQAAASTPTASRRGRHPRRIRAACCGRDGGAAASTTAARSRPIAFIYCVGSRQGAERRRTPTAGARATAAAPPPTWPCRRGRSSPPVRSYHFYRDMRTYGKFESLYEEARQVGIGLPALPRGAAAARREATATPGWSRCRTC
ncbi:MAG: hypothetical protein MZV70_60150 [Desulfobacterales bacterium]|nr:hypothetical protein [Desulfobacterales bacterium]